MALFDRFLSHSALASPNKVSRNINPLIVQGVWYIISLSGLLDSGYQIVIFKGKNQNSKDTSDAGFSNAYISC